MNFCSNVPETREQQRIESSLSLCKFLHHKDHCFLSSWHRLILESNFLKRERRGTLELKEALKVNIYSMHTFRCCKYEDLYCPQGAPIPGLVLRKRKSLIHSGDQEIQSIGEQMYFYFMFITNVEGEDSLKSIFSDMLKQPTYNLGEKS